MAVESAGLGLLGTFGLTALAGASLLGAVSSWGQGEAANDIAQINAKRLEQQAIKSRTTTAVNLYRQKQYADKVEGSQIAAIGKSGGTIDDPTSQAILKETGFEASLDEWLIKNAGTSEYFNLKSEASNQRLQGKSARAAGRMGALATLLGGAASGVGAYKTMVP
jgi:hypothetical protein